MLKAHPRTRNAFAQAGKPLVAKVSHLNGDYLPTSVKKAVELLGGIDKVVKPGDSVMVKPNFNCSYLTPLSTDLAFLAAAIELLQDAGAKVTVGELSGRADWPTSKVVHNLGVMPVLERYGVEFIDFEFDEWVEVAVNGEWWKSYKVPRSIYEAEKRVNLPNMRCHSSGRFSASLKLSVGWINLDDRDYLHEDNDTTEVKAAELNLVWQPDLILMDGRRSTITWHGRGDYVYPNLVMASGDLVAIDTEAVKILKQFPENNRLDIPIEEMGQIKQAAKLGIGSMDYIVVEAPANTHTEEEGQLKDPAMQAVAVAEARAL